MPKRLFQRGADGGERGQVAGVLHPRAGVARIGGQEESDILGVVQRRGVQHDALEVFGEAFAQACAVLRGWAAAARKLSLRRRVERIRAGRGTPLSPRLSRRKSR